MRKQGRLPINRQFVICDQIVIQLHPCSGFWPRASPRREHHHTESRPSHRWETTLSTRQTSRTFLSGGMEPAPELPQAPHQDEGLGWSLSIGPESKQLSAINITKHWTWHATAHCPISHQTSQSTDNIPAQSPDCLPAPGLVNPESTDSRLSTSQTTFLPSQQTAI